MHDNISTALITAFEQHYDTRWDDAQLRNERLAWRAAWNAAGAAPAAVAGPARDWPDTCDGKEQEAFEAWAQRERHNMEQHPLHYLFLDAETNAARQGWRAGLLYAVGQMKTQAAPALEAPAAPVRKPLTRDGVAAWAAETLEEIDYPVLCKTAPCAFELLNLLEAFARDHGITAAAPQAPAAPALSAAPIPVMPRAITAGLGLDDSGEEPAYCVMAAFRSEDDARYALSILSAGLGATAAPAAPAVDAQAHAETLKKAARYDFLRGSNVANGTVLAEHFGGSRMQDFDAVIDAKIAARAAQAKEGGA